MFILTTQAITTDKEDVAKMALEFWSSMFEEEYDEDQAHSLQIGSSIALHLGPTLLDTLLKQSHTEDDEDEEYDIVEAAQCCLQNLVALEGGKMTSIVIPFVNANRNGEWRNRDAAFFAFGTLMDTESDQLAAFVPPAVPELVAGISDQNFKVSDTCCWTLGQILEYQRSLLSPEQIHQVLEALMAAIDNPALVVSKQAINALLNFADSFSDDEDKNEVETNGLSPFVAILVMKLLLVAADPACRSKVEAYEAASRFIENSARDIHPFILQVSVEAVNRLEASFTSTESKSDRSITQGLICGVVNNCYQKLDRSAIVTVVDKTMGALLKILSVEGESAKEETFMAIGFIADTLESDFDRYTASIVPFLLNSLKKPEEHDVFLHAIMALSAICKACGQQLCPYTDAIVMDLLSVLSSPTTRRSLKPNIIGVFCDLALNIGPIFERYADAVLNVLNSAHATAIEDISQLGADEDAVEFIESLRLNILEAYTGIVHGLEEGKLSVLHPHIDNIFTFICRIIPEVSDPEISNELLKSAIGLIGDLANSIGGPLLNHLTQEPITKALGLAITQASGNGDEEEDASLRETVNYTRGIIEQIKQNSVQKHI